MKILTKTIKAYTYNELSESAKEKVKQMILNDKTHDQIFYDDIVYFLSKTFKHSDLKVTYSLGSCQGDGLNIYGTLDLYDFIKLWDTEDKAKRTIKFYCEFINEYKFFTNNRYCYSCKFLDKKYISDAIDEHIEILEDNQIMNINTALITKFYNDMIDYFAKLDVQFAKDGYRWFYEIYDDEAQEECEANEYYFNESGDYINTFDYVEV